jgi:ferritin-like metal-binding protein YciE
MQLRTLEDVLEHEIQDMYDAETQVKKAMPDMIKAVNDEKLKKSFEKHAQQTEDQLKRLEEAAGLLGIQVKGAQCEGMAGLINEGKKLFKEEASPVLDAALISSAQRIEHYEIAGYGTAATLAETLGETQAANLLKQNLGEEKKTDELLTQIAEKAINDEAMHEDSM